MMDEIDTVIELRCIFQEEISKLLRYESSLLPPGEKVSIAEYCNRMRPGQRDIYYLASPSRELAESSAYFEGMYFIIS